MAREYACQVYAVDAAGQLVWAAPQSFAVDSAAVAQRVQDDWERWVAQSCLADKHFRKCATARGRGIVAELRVATFAHELDKGRFASFPVVSTPAHAGISIA